MGLLNYTTKIDPDKTAQEIAKCLSMHGASAVLTEYSAENSYVSAISFQIKVGEQKMGFRLPCDWKPVFASLPRTQRYGPIKLGMTVGRASRRCRPCAPRGASSCSTR